MMVVDTSVVVCIALGEPDALLFATALAKATHKVLPAPAHLEAAMVLRARLGTHFAQRLSDVLTAASLAVIPFTPSMAELAIAAFERFGKGYHPASLNFGDCCSYAAAKALGQPLLYKGNDFAQTDIASALTVFN
jgi:ribonuclease VapC